MPSIESFASNSAVPDSMSFMPAASSIALATSIPSPFKSTLTSIFTISTKMSPFTLPLNIFVLKPLKPRIFLLRAILDVVLKTSILPVTILLISILPL